MGRCLGPGLRQTSDDYSSRRLDHVSSHFQFERLRLTLNGVLESAEAYQQARCYLEMAVHGEEIQVGAFGSEERRNRRA